MTKILIAGPCAAESKEVIRQSIHQAKKAGIDYLRVSLWKPRTQPGFEGLGEKGIPLLQEAAKAGVNPATEVMLPEHVQMVIDHVLPINKKVQVLLWIGSRNQNHFLQRAIAKVATSDSRVRLMIKNQPWHNEKHWLGIIHHVLEGGIPKKNLLVCHRGFAPGKHEQQGYRNPPDFEMAMNIKKKTRLPMIFDPSHAGGTVANVKKLAIKALKYDFDGFMIEVHPHPRMALTDGQQQLTWKEFVELKKILV